MIAIILPDAMEDPPTDSDEDTVDLLRTPMCSETRQESRLRLYLREKKLNGPLKLYLVSCDGG